ncbi:Carbohydrate sulfotransferase 2 [Mizuhopecten yessoensis]|uniref:Carbohydrate sulfotransferase 2 n=1 Tax=Mizuhopecten yessoensis TaxID=6573 RepID=A0A210PGI9_MIZYE|nr:Carbohydrate sulfotransferase 2 [Mizuhopecten yessoensis]
MNSRQGFKWTPVPGGAVSLCNKMTQDYLESLKIKQVYPGRLCTVFYEDMTTNPVKTFRKIYDFVGYQFNAAEQLRLTTMTASKAEADPGNTYRHDSLKTARAWRNQINTNVLTKTNKVCSKLYRLLGYPQLKNLVELNNTNIPLRLAEKEINNP